MGLIKLSLAELRDTASDFQRASQEVAEVNQRVNGRAAQLLGNWEGVASQSFMQELASCQQQTQRTPAIYAEVAAALNATANRIEQADQESAASQHSVIVSDN
ncbi:MAG TPA: WXG100 family type VII secretion target [Anaerolineae bacterium]|nr:WXG100 family type VII secretion target [Anaerolineae bacterium]